MMYCLKWQIGASSEIEVKFRSYDHFFNSLIQQNLQIYPHFLFLPIWPPYSANQMPELQTDWTIILGMSCYSCDHHLVSLIRKQLRIEAHFLFLPIWPPQSANQMSEQNFGCTIILGMRCYPYNQLFNSLIQLELRIEAPLPVYDCQYICACQWRPCWNFANPLLK